MMKAKEIKRETWRTTDAEDLVRVRNGLMLSLEDALILQLAVQGLELTNASASAREFCGRCRETWK